jgi:hypothetical protein
VAGPNASRVIRQKDEMRGNEIMPIPPRNIQALACCAGACLQSSCTWGNFNRRRWGIFNRRKLGNIQPALTQTGHSAFERKNFYSATVSVSRNFCHPRSEPFYTDGRPSI